MNALSLRHVNDDTKSDGDIFIESLLRLDPNAKYYGSPEYANVRKYLAEHYDWPQVRIDATVGYLRKSNRIRLSGSRRTISIVPPHQAGSVGMCVYCRKRTKQLNRDHIIPKSRGGSDNHDNIVWCCELCNQCKADRTPHEWALEILNFRRPTPAPAMRLPPMAALRMFCFRIASIVRGAK